MKRMIVVLGAAGIALVAVLTVPSHTRARSEAPIPAWADTIPAVRAVPPPVRARSETSIPVGAVTSPKRVIDAIAWSIDATEYRGQNGSQITFTCPARGVLGSVWGTEVYSDDSSICTAAVHADAIEPFEGGEVTIEILPGQESYAASERNGVASQAYGAWTGSFRVVGAAQYHPDVLNSWTANATKYRGQYGLRTVFGCLPSGPLGPVWGTDVYSDDSSVCTAAVHMGWPLLQGRGGSVTIEMRPGQESYAASERNGVTSHAYEAWPGSFVIVDVCYWTLPWVTC